MTKLTDHDRLTLAQGDQFRVQNGIAAIRKDNGEPDTIAAMAIQIGKAQFLIGELTAMVRRMDGDVILRWEDPEDAGEFLRLREQLRSHGWLPDPAADELRRLTGASEVVSPADLAPPPN